MVGFLSPPHLPQNHSLTRLLLRDLQNKSDVFESTSMYHHDSSISIMFCACAFGINSVSQAHLIYFETLSNLVLLQISSRALSHSEPRLQFQKVNRGTRKYQRQRDGDHSPNPRYSTSVREDKTCPLSSFH